MKLDDKWFTEQVASGVKSNAPGLYQWFIVGVGAYVGHAVNLGTVAKRYKHNVERCLAGLEYHNKGRDFRLIHKALANGIIENKAIVLTLLENVEAKADRNMRKKELVEELRAELESGGLRMLNGSGRAVAR